MPRKQIRIDSDDIGIKNVARYDQGEIIGSTEISDEGFLKTDAVVTRLGIFTYKNGDGSLRKELRHPDDVLRLASLNSMKMIPITNDHPAERLVDATTAKQLQVGYTGENIRPDGKFIISPIVITDSVAVEAVRNGKDSLSLGYSVDLIKEDGEYDGQRYDYRQTNVRYNHLAIVDRARAGSEVRINMDSEDAICVEDALGEGKGVGGKRQGIGGANKCICPSCGFTETHDRGTPCTNRTCPKCGTKMVGANVDAVLTTKKRKALPDSSFCFVRGRGIDKVRKFPAHDAVHVRNALSRLSQSNLSSSDKAKVLTCLKRKAKSFGIEVSQDRSDDISLDDYNLNINDLTSINKKGDSMDLATIRIDNIDYEAAQEVVNAYTKSVGRVDELEEEVKTATDEKEALQAKLDTAEEELKTLKEHDVKQDVADAVKVRLDLERTAEKILDEKEKENLDSMADVDIKKAVILKKFPDAKEKLDAEDVTDVYIDARFDAAVESIENSSPSSIADQRRKSTPRNDGTNNDSVKDAREKMIEKQQNAYKFDRKDDDK